jgi:hypothetical protein
MHTLKASAIIAARLVLVTSFVVAMPCWALLRAYEQAAECGRHASAKAPLPAVVPPPAWDPPFERSFVGPAENKPPPVAAAATRPIAWDERPVRERILAIEARLQGLGASYMRLTYRPDPAPGDRLPSRLDRYHFLCQMPLPDHTPYCKPFEAAAHDPDAAMRLVLEQVERWLQAGVRE